MSIVPILAVAEDFTVAPIQYNKIQDIKHLPFDLMIMRHGPAVPNDKHQIISDLPNGKQPEYGLTKAGREAVRESIIQELTLGRLRPRPLIVSSPFSRTLDTAREAGALLQVPAEDILVDERLRERFFGKFNLGSTERYEEVWNWDRSDPEARYFLQNRVETVNAVLARTTEVVRDLVRAHAVDSQRRQVLLVLHGDTGQILETGVRHINPGQHRDKVVALKPAEIRFLN